MKSLALLVLLGFIAVAVFGFVGMNAAMDHDAGCIASLVNVATCPLQGIASVVYHANAYASFSQAILISTFVLLALFALLMLVSFTRAPSLLHVRVRNQVRERGGQAPEQKFIRWLSLFENSPSL